MIETIVIGLVVGVALIGCVIGVVRAVLSGGLGDLGGGVPLPPQLTQAEREAVKRKAERVASRM